MGVTLRPFTDSDRTSAHDALVTCRSFTPVEVEVASAMIDEGLVGRFCLLALEEEGAFAGYACFGPAAMTQSSWYLYWICIRADAQRRGLGRALQEGSERTMAEAGGTQLVIEASGRPDNEAVRRFYCAAGFAEAGRLVDFYRAGDDCVIYRKVLGGAKHGG